jgi:hypothetical protein
MVGTDTQPFNHAANREDAMTRQHQQQTGSRSATTAPVDVLVPGAHLITEREGFIHHGIYVGHCRVVHYAGLCRSLHAGPIEVTTLDQFASGHPVSVRSERSARFVGRQAVERALSRVGEDRYHLLTNNCEHFCSWCLSGESRSEQVEACLQHPRAAVSTLLTMFRTFLATGRTTLQPALRVA